MTTLTSFRRALFHLWLYTNFASPVFAQVSLGTALKLNETDGVASVFPYFSDVLTAIVPNIFVVSGIILLAYLVFGGFTIIASAGNPESSAKGKQAITNAIIGFVIIFASYWIIQAIQVLTGVPILNYGMQVIE